MARSRSRTVKSAPPSTPAVGVGMEASGEFTGKYLVLLRDDGVKEGLQAIRDASGLKEVCNAADYGGAAVEMAEAERAEVFKGHIVRREDVAWGKTYAELRRANGDTYHVTNCSPQVAGFNRSALGEDNWGDLEDHVLKGAATERYCQFSGPVLDPADEVFVGRTGGRARVRVKIPSRYWKVLVVQTSEGLASYGFVLEQDLSDVPLEEFVVPENFACFMEPIADIQAVAGVRFPDVVLSADRFGTDEGVEVALGAGVKRRSKTPEAITEGLIV